jgi:lipopolysaccharide biosynthesis regulator YciM
MEMTTWIPIVAALVIVLIAGMRVFGGRERDAVETDPSYVQALEAIAKHDFDTAVVRLRESIRARPSSFDPYLLLGDVLRDRGDVDRSIRLHRELSLRPGLDRKKKFAVLMSLARDQIRLGRYDAAVETCRRVLAIEKKDRSAFELLVSAYEGRKMWDEAVETAGKLARFYDEDEKSFMAQYLSLVAKEEMVVDRDAAKKKLKRALSLDNSCELARLTMGDIYFDEKKYSKAIEIWSGLLKLRPGSIEALSGRLETAYFEGGHFGDMTDVYEDLSHDLPSNPAVLIGLSRMYHRRGETDAALRLAVEARNLDARNPDIYRTLLELYAGKRDHESLFTMLKEYFEQEAERARRRERSADDECGDGFLWKCALKDSSGPRFDVPAEPVKKG